MARGQAFCDRFGLGVPILLAPMAGACPPSLSIAVMQAGGMGACGALLMQPVEIEAWGERRRASQSDKPFQINLWIPDPDPIRDVEHESRAAGISRQLGTAGRYRGRGRNAAGFCRTVSDSLEDSTANGVVRDGRLPGGTRYGIEEGRDQVVCERHNRCRGDSPPRLPGRT